MTCAVRNGFLDFDHQPQRTSRRSRSVGSIKDTPSLFTDDQTQEGGWIALGREVQAQELRAVQDVCPDAEVARPLMVWKRMTMRSGCCNIQRRWTRLTGKLLLLGVRALLRQKSIPSIGSLSHACGRECAPCRFNKTGRCFDGEYCQGCHFSCDHKLDPRSCRKARRAARRTSCNSGSSTSAGSDSASESQSR
mmetsp:Transcript_50017/g.109350  ORF Transcript_50017/g.109350 Transcript_50017/m.109350 type:complete len:193 (+) Transcript_50017:64-642(+)